MSEWISIKERLPAVGQKVFTWDEDFPGDPPEWEELISVDPVDWSKSYGASHFFEVNLPEPPW